MASRTGRTRRTGRTTASRSGTTGRGSGSASSTTTAAAPTRALAAQPAAAAAPGVTSNVVIDLSHHNQISSVAKLTAAGIKGVIHKATQGTGFVDPNFVDRRKQLKDAGVLLGAYHFGIAGEGSAQADHLLDVAGEDTLLVLDLEGNPQGFDMALEEAEEFVHHIAARTGHFPGLYSGHTIKEMLSNAGIRDPNQTVLSQCWLWIAQYGPKPLIPVIWPKWTLWQYTDGAAGPEPHTVDGVGRCDRDQFNGSEEELLAFWESNSSGS